jgi:hypothetical protein
MKIIKQGKPQNLPMIVDCTRCGLTAECTKEEGNYIRGDQREGAMYEFTCPNCKHLMYGYPNE